MIFGVFEHTFITQEGAPRSAQGFPPIKKQDAARFEGQLHLESWKMPEAATAAPHADTAACAGQA